MKKIFALLPIVFLLTSCGKKNPQSIYESAYVNTEALEHYSLTIKVTSTVNDGTDEKTQATVQRVSISETDGEEIYSVNTEEYSYDGEQSESSYVYYGGKYYISMPGVKYSSATDEESADKNIYDLTHIISLSYEKLYNVSENDGTYAYDIEGEDLSEYVLSLLQTSADYFGDESFSADHISGAASVSDGYVTGRSLEAVYFSESGSKFTLLVETQLDREKPTVEKPDDSKYLNM